MYMCIMMWVLVGLVGERMVGEMFVVEGYGVGYGMRVGEVKMVGRS